MKVDRALQKKILERLYSVYPLELDHDEIPSIHPEDPNLVLANLAYLHGHGLVEVVRPRNNHYRTGKPDELYHSNAVITSAGIDFLADDGGLSAILGVVTVKLHDETIKALLASKVEASDLPPEEKQSLLGQIRDLRAEAAKHLVTKLIDYGIGQGPNAMQWLSETFKSLP